MNEEGNCQPKPDFFKINCNPDSITVEMSTEVVPNAKDVFLMDDCEGTFDSDRLGSIFKTLSLCYIFTCVLSENPFKERRGI